MNYRLLNVKRALGDNEPPRIADRVLPVMTLCLLMLNTAWMRQGDAAARPNFVVFLTDDQAYTSMSCTGNTVLETPAIDRLAAEGVLFENAFVTTAICCCSRACILTGQYMRRNGIEDFEKPLSADQLQQTFPVLLRDAGYRTAFLGKYAIGSPKVDQQLALPGHLFDLWYGFPQSIAFKQQVAGKDRYLTTVMTEKAVEFLNSANDDQPFFLMVALKEPHGPLNYFDPDFPKPYASATIPIPENMTRESFDSRPAPVRESLGAMPSWADSHESFRRWIRERYAYISRADLAVKQICDALTNNGLDNNTIVIFMADHGDLSGAHSLTGKWLMYEESIRIPMIISDPRLPVSTRGRRSQMVLNIDLAPTLLSMAGVAIPDRMQGESLQPILHDPNAKGRADWFYEHVYSPNPPRNPIPKIEGVRTERWKYTRYTESSPLIEELFDLQSDPHEEHNLVNGPTSHSTLEFLRRRCDEYSESLK